MEELIMELLEKRGGYNVAKNIISNNFEIGDYIVAISHPYDRVERISKIDEDGFLYSETGLYSNPFFMRYATNDELEVGTRLDD